MLSPTTRTSPPKNGTGTVQTSPQNSQTKPESQDSQPHTVHILPSAEQLTQSTNDAQPSPVAPARPLFEFGLDTGITIGVKTQTVRQLHNIGVTDNRTNHEPAFLVVTNQGPNNH